MLHKTPPGNSRPLQAPAGQTVSKEVSCSSGPWPSRNGIVGTLVGAQSPQVRESVCQQRPRGRHWCLLPGLLCGSPLLWPMLPLGSDGAGAPATPPLSPPGTWRCRSPASPGGPSAGSLFSHRAPCGHSSGHSWKGNCCEEGVLGGPHTPQMRPSPASFRSRQGAASWGPGRLERRPEEKGRAGGCAWVTGRGRGSWLQQLFPLTPQRLFLSKT